MKLMYLISAACVCSILAISCRKAGMSLAPKYISKIAGWHSWSGTSHEIISSGSGSKIWDTTYLVTDTFRISELNSSTLSDGLSNSTLPFISQNDSEIAFSMHNFKIKGLDFVTTTTTISFNYLTALIKEDYLENKGNVIISETVLYAY